MWKLKQGFVKAAVSIAVRLRECPLESFHWNRKWFSISLAAWPGILFGIFAVTKVTARTDDQKTELLRVVKSHNGPLWLLCYLA